MESFFSCTEARKALKEGTPDLILMDWNLPDGDGLALCREIREQRNIPVLMITARDMEIDQVMCLSAGQTITSQSPFPWQC